MNEELWKPVAGYEGRYEVSNLGRVRSLDMRKRIGGGWTMLHRGRVLKASPDANGYPVVNIRPHTLVHRIVAIAFIPNPEKRPQVNHKNGNRADCRAENLEWATASENTLHAFRVLHRKANRTPGEKHANARLTEAQVRDIRVLAKYLRHAEIAPMFGVGRRQITAIVQGRAWRHLWAN